MASNAHLYDNFNPNRCNKCFMANRTKASTGTRVVCKNCKLIKYCGIKHQTFDWNLHRPFCDAVVSVMTATNAKHILGCAETILQEDGEGDARQALQRKIDCSMYVVEKLLGRTLQYHERVLLQQPAVCQHCLAVDEGAQFELCAECHQVAYCSKQHQALDQPKHSRWCAEYRLNFILYDAPRPLTYVEAIVALDEDTRKAFPQDNYQLASAIVGREVRKPTPDGPAMELAEELGNIKNASAFCWVGTALHTLRVSKMLDELREQLTVFIIGSEKEILFFNPTTCAAFFLYIPTLRRVRLYHIGPEFAMDGNIMVQYTSGQQVEHIRHTHKFHQLPKNCELDHPHLIIAYNCGFSEFEHSDSWSQTIRALLQFRSVPFAFTSYTQAEAIADSTVVLRESLSVLGTHDKLTFVQRASVNPFRDLLPLRNPDILDENDTLYYDNGYLSIAIAKK